MAHSVGARFIATMEVWELNIEYRTGNYEYRSFYKLHNSEFNIDYSKFSFSAMS